MKSTCFAEIRKLRSAGWQSQASALEISLTCSLAILTSEPKNDTADRRGGFPSAGAWFSSTHTSCGMGLLDKERQAPTETASVPGLAAVLQGMPAVRWKPS